MEIALIEDDARTRAANAALFEAAGTPHEPVVVTAFASAEAYQFSRPAVDLLVLDIRLSGMDGMTLAKTVRAIDPAVPLAFVSNYDEYVFEGYDVNALAYVMKPLTAAKVAALLAKVQAHRPPATVLVVTGRGAQQVPLYDLMAIEVRDHALAFHLQDQVLEAPGQLKDYLTLPGFIQIYRSVVVNLSFVRQLTASAVVMADGSHYPVARSQRARVKAAFFAHYRGLAHDDTH
ncbi:LytR/AlgR family response regulator transcription factor [Lacticaseibacillus daqingensis]|uniref:LytR/AlgR family response regulator transcription factor n=1 Tax=Lacticaseibacillus daqingensis TaxID=2486014 RepID=UPI000F7B456E|nr:LytTR family DNA-binding domain-containing protein [Lacticaseibacillus daqingensis]